MRIGREGRGEQLGKVLSLHFTVSCLVFNLKVLLHSPSNAENSPDRTELGRLIRVGLHLQTQKSKHYHSRIQRKKEERKKETALPQKKTKEKDPPPQEKNQKKKPKLSKIQASN